MKDKEPKIHPLVRVRNALLIAALAAGQVRCNPQPQTPEATSTGTSPALTVEPPLGFEPSTPTPGSISTLPGGETPTPTESAVAAFRAPTLEELVVPMGEGGPLPEYAQGYYNVMDRAKADVVQKVGIDPNKVKIRYWDNTGSQYDFGWMLYYQIEGAGVIWPLKPDGTLADYSTYFEGQVQPDGSIVNLRINSDYNNWVVAGDKNTAAIFGGTLPVVVDFPKDADVNGETKLVYSRWLRPGGQPVDYAKDFSEWQETSGISEPTSTLTETQTPTPEAAIPGTEIVSHYTETIKAEDTKYNIPVTIITDEKMVNANPMMTIDKIYANDDPDFRTRYGETAKEAIAHAVAYAEYQCWQKNDPDKVSQRAGVSFDSYWKMVQEAQQGKRDWGEVEFQTWANDLTTPEYDAIKRTFRPGNPVTIAYVNSYPNTMVDLFKGEVYFGTEFDAKGNLGIYIGGYPILASLQGIIVDSTSTVGLAEALDRLSWKSQGNALTEKEFYEHAAPIGRYNSKIFNILSIQSTPPEGWSNRFKDWPWVPGFYNTALAITPNDKAELFSQP